MIDIVAGWDPRETVGFSVCLNSLRHSSRPLQVIPLMEPSLRGCGIYWREHQIKDNQLWCPISQAPMSTSFANSRFLTKWLAGSRQWALFCDFADMLFLADPVELFRLADPQYAVMVVKRDYAGTEGTKMDGQIQTQYSRKNWSSMVLWNLCHRANQKLTLEMVNTLPGRDLHRFCWLEDDEIGSLPLAWNYLVGVDPETEVEVGVEPKLLHYTLGSPELGVKGPYSEKWLQEYQLAFVHEKAA